MVPVVSSRTIGWILGVTISCLTLASVVGDPLKHVAGHGWVYGLVPLFNLDHERNIPTWYASSTLFVCCTLLTFIGLTERVHGSRRVKYWFGLALIFMFLSVDEAVSLHEVFTIPLRNSLNLTSVFHFSWVIVYLPLAAIVGVAYLRFLGHLEPATRWRFITAGALFVGGALGMEMLAGIYTASHGTTNLVYAMFATTEEVLEMTGIAVFICALATFAQASFGQLASRYAPTPDIVPDQVVTA